ncbi:MAG: response regulator [Sedimentisphaerales bacterium]|nr:response regulator [Sedimentisphaerales bacterium]
MAGRKVLVVDDEIHIVHVVAVKLRNNGFEVISAGNGEEGFKLACEEKPDIIIADLKMPVMTGLEMVEKLRGCEQTKDIPVIVLTARGFDIEDDRKRDLRISEYLSKPFSPKKLLKDVEDILYQRQLVQKN